MRKQKVLQWIILLAIVVIGGYTIFSGFFKEKETSVSIGQVAPNFHLATLDGQAHKLTDYRGQPIVVNFWGSFCEPCVREMPLLSEMANEYESKGILTIGINLDEAKVVVQGFIRNNPVDYPIYLDPGGKVRDKYEVISYPTTFFIDAEGKIVDKYTGELDEQKLRTFLDKLVQ